MLKRKFYILQLIQVTMVWLNKSDYCVFYFNEQETPTTRKSGAKFALDYAVKKNKTIFNLAEE